MLVELLLSAAVSTIAAKPYTFQGATLGMALDQFRALPTEKGEVACTGDQKNRSDPDEVRVSDYGMARIGVVKCVYYYWPTETAYSGHVNGFPIADGQGSVSDYSYRFVLDPADRKLRLYEIKLISHIRVMPTIVSTLSASYGPPKVRTKSVKQNGFGQQIPSENLVWANGVSTIAVDGPFQTVSDVVVAYRLTRLAKIVIAAQNSPPPAPNGL